MKRFGVIMAGGSGERFWPLSRQMRPKQLLRLSSPDETMLEEAVNRIVPLVGTDGVYISTSRQLVGPISDSDVVSDRHILAEPLKRNTLGALVWVVASLIAEGNAPSETSIAILTADHMIDSPEEFRACVDDALSLAEHENGLVTIGITPSRPETGFGYIEFDKDSQHAAGYSATSFREKPDLATAETFISKGNFLWNSGMFFFRMSSFIEELTKAQPQSAEILHGIVDALKQKSEAAAIALFEALPNLSVDYAVMEKAEKVFVVPSRFGWDDLGAWDALERSMPTDEGGSVLEGHTVTIDCENCIVYNDDEDAMVTVLGMRDLIVVVTKDAVLVCPKDQAQRVKEIVTSLKQSDTKLPNLV